MGRKLCAPSETRLTPPVAQEARELGRHGLGVRLHGELVRVGKRGEEPRELVAAR